MPSLADTLRANLAQRPPLANPPNPPAPQPASTPHDLPPDASPAPPPPATLLHIPLSLLRTDAHQPRRYLPDDLRRSFQSAQADARSVVRALLERAQRGDLEAQGYLAGLRDLAESINRVGLQQPLRVSQETSRAGSALFRIVDGERRFWALALLDLEAPLSAGRTAAAILHDPTATADDIQRAQWAANLCREDIPAIDLAQAVWRIREDYFTRLAIDPQPYTASFGDRAASLSLNDKALTLTQAEIARLTGRTLSERTLYTYLALAEKVKPTAAALARAYSLSLRQLNGLTGLNEDEQVSALLRMVGKATPTGDATPGEFSIAGTDSVKELETWVERTLGLTADAFLLSALLRQGEADALLKAKSTERHEVLCQMVDLSRYQRLYERAAKAYSDSESQAKVCKEQLQRVQAVSGTEIEEADAQLADANEHLQELLDRRLAIAGIKSQAQTWAALAERLTQTQSDLVRARSTIAEEAQIESDAQRKVDLDRVLPTLTEFVRLTDKLAQANLSIAKLEEKAETGKGSYQSAVELREKQQAEVDALTVQRDALQEQLDNLAERLTELQTVVDVNAHIADLRVKCEKQISLLSAFPEPLDDVLAEAQSTLEHLQLRGQALPWLREFAGARKDWRKHQQELADTLEQMRRLGADRAHSEVEHENLVREIDEGEARRRAAESTRDVARSQAAEAKKKLLSLQSLGGKATCDLCGQALSPDHYADEHANRNQSLEAAQKNVAAAEAAYKVACDTLEQNKQWQKQIDADLGRLRRHQESSSAKEAQCREGIAAAEKQGAAAMEHLPAELAAQVRTSADQMGGAIFAGSYPDSANLAQIKQECDQRDAWQAKVKELSAGIADRDKLLAARETLLKQVQDLESQYPEGQRMEALSERERARAAQADSRRKLDGVKKLLLSAEQNLRQAQDARHNADTALRSVQALLQSEYSRRADIQERFSHGQAELAKHEWLTPSEWTADHLARLENEATALGDAELRLKQLNEARLAIRGLEQAEAEITHSMHDVPQEARRSVQDIANEEQACQRQYIAAQQSQLAAIQRKNDLEERRAQHGKWLEAYNQSTRKAQLSKTLAELLDRKHLQHFLLQQIEQAIIAHANKTLDRISSGRMRLELRSDDGANSFDMVAYNKDAGAKPILVNFLSGGQRFRVAVSLAMGIGQYASQSGQRIESVIIDEGFGSLDQQGRVEMTEELRQLQTVLKRVIVVSHQEDFVSAFSSRYLIRMVDGSSTVSLVE